MSSVRNKCVNAAVLGIFVGGWAMSGCATVTVKKVPTPTQYVHWTDEMQRRADTMEGLRFYLPRPFVNVFESFPIRTDIYLANGEVSSDGKYVIVTSVTTESGLSRYIANDTRDVRVPMGTIFDGSSDTAAFSTPLNAAKDLVSVVDTFTKLRDIVGSSVPTGSVGTPPPTPPAQQPPPTPPAPQQPTGINKRTMKNDNGAFAYQPLRGNFDLVYLPDFEEQFVISSEAGLGNAMFQVNLGQGWSLQGFDSLVDNSELNRRIFDLIDTSIKVAKDAASGFLGGIPGLAGATVSGNQIVPMSTGLPDDAKRIPGSPVTLKIVIVHYASKGLYPIIKPRELQERVKLPTQQASFLANLFEPVPRLIGASEMDPTEIARSQLSIESQTGSFTVPRYPYQYVSFNTFRYMAIETVAPTTADSPPFKHKYDKTGTQGSTGDARTGELDRILGVLIPMLRGTNTESENDVAKRERSATIEARLASEADKWAAEFVVLPAFSAAKKIHTKAAKDGTGWKLSFRPVDANNATVTSVVNTLKQEFVSKIKSDAILKPHAGSISVASDDTLKEPE